MATQSWRDRAINLATRGRVYAEPLPVFDFRNAFGAADVNAPKLYPQNLYTPWGDPFTVLEYSQLPAGMGGICENGTCGGEVPGGISLGYNQPPHPIALPARAYQAPPAGALMSPAAAVADMSNGEKIALGVSVAAAVGAIAFLALRKKQR